VKRFKAREDQTNRGFCMYGQEVEFLGEENVSSRKKAETRNYKSQHDAAFLLPVI